MIEQRSFIQEMNPWVLPLGNLDAADLMGMYEPGT